MFDRLLGPVVSAPVRAGRPGRELGARLDLVTSAGVRSSWRRLRGEPLLRSYRTEVYNRYWREAAATVGASVEARSGGLLEIRLGGRTTWIFRQEVALDSSVTLRASRDKTLLHDVLAAAGIPVPDHVVCDVRSLGPASGFWPARWSRGQAGPGDGGRHRRHRQRAHRAAAAPGGAPGRAQGRPGACRDACARPCPSPALPRRRAP